MLRNCGISLVALFNYKKIVPRVRILHVDLRVAWKAFWQACFQLNAQWPAASCRVCSVGDPDLWAPFRESPPWLGWGWGGVGWGFPDMKEPYYSCAFIISCIFLSSFPFSAIILNYATEVKIIIKNTFKTSWVDMYLVLFYSECWAYSV